MSYTNGNNNGDYNLNGRYVPQQVQQQPQRPATSGTIAQIPPKKSGSNSMSASASSTMNPQFSSAPTPNSYGYNSSSQNVNPGNMHTNVNTNVQQMQAPAPVQGQAAQQYQYQQPQPQPQQGVPPSYQPQGQQPYGQQQQQQVIYGAPGGYPQSQPNANPNMNMNMGYNQQQQQPVQYNYQYGQPQPVMQPQGTTTRHHGRVHHYGQNQMNMQYQPQFQQQQQQQQHQQQFNQSAVPMNNPRKKVTLKLVILGNSGVGKTSFMNRYHSDKFTGQYKATIGADFLSKKISVTPKPSPGGGPAPAPQEVVLTIWDTAGQERFQSLGKAFYRGSDVCVLVFDVTDRSSFDGLQKWKEEFDSCVNGSGGGSSRSGSGVGNNFMNNRIVNGSVLAHNSVKCIVVGNKVDKVDSNRAVTKEEGMEYAKSIGTEYFEASAKTAINVDATFLAAARAGLEYNNKKNMGTGMNMGGMVGQNGMRGGYSGMKGYEPPRRTVDLNRGNNSNVNDFDCC